MRLLLAVLFVCLAFPAFAGPKEVAAYRAFDRVCTLGAASPKSLVSRAKKLGAKRISVGEAKWKYGTAAKMWRYHLNVARSREVYIAIEGSVCTMQFEMLDYTALRELFERKFSPNGQFEDETGRSVRYGITVNWKKKPKAPVTVLLGAGKIASNKNMLWLTAMPDEEFQKRNAAAIARAEPCVAGAHPAKCS